MHSPDRNDSHRTAVLGLARGSIEHGLAHREPLSFRPDELSPVFAEPAATFTTLRLQDELRGCCGALEARHPLATDVARSAFQAAFRDPRFAPVGEDELDAISLEVSVLSPLEPIHVDGEADLLAQLMPGIDGLVIDTGEHRATFLPKVWEMLPEPRRFLAALKSKCGLAENYWSDALRFERYRTTTYAEGGGGASKSGKRNRCR